MRAFACRGALATAAILVARTSLASRTSRRRTSARSGMPSAVYEGEDSRCEQVELRKLIRLFGFGLGQIASPKGTPPSIVCERRAGRGDGRSHGRLVRGGEPRSMKPHLKEDRRNGSWSDFAAWNAGWPLRSWGNARDHRRIERHFRLFQAGRPPVLQGPDQPREEWAIQPKCGFSLPASGRQCSYLARKWGHAALIDLQVPSRKCGTAIAKLFHAFNLASRVPCCAVDPFDQIASTGHPCHSDRPGSRTI